MYVEKNFSFKRVLLFSGGHIVWITIWVTMVALLYYFTPLSDFNIPWLPISVIGTAVAFYIGFKNNQAYERLWEARKIWGAIVNSSRALGSAVKGFVGNQFVVEDVSDAEVETIHKRLIYRHIAWLYALRSQLLVPTQWEHVSQSKHIRKQAERFKRKFGLLDLEGEVRMDDLHQYLRADEVDELLAYKNTATQIIDRQSQDLKQLRKLGFIDDFRHMELQKILNDFYIHQGKAERIKKFPLPRQYGSVSFIFVGIFIFLLPFGMTGAFNALGPWGVWVSIPFSIIICWVYVMMELVGDYSENPFEGLGNDIPMLSLCRVIELDLREMLGETELPPAIEARNGVLM